MNDLSVEALKQMDLVAFLRRYYGLDLQRRAAAWACSSPFGRERTPSFFVRLVDGHWVFKDFSSNVGGTIFDFVRMKEKLPGFSQALAFVRRLIADSLGSAGQADSVGQSHSSAGNSAAAGGGPAAERPYDVEKLYLRFRDEDPAVCREYLLRRAIAPELVEALIAGGTVVHNRYRGRSYCCFAVRDDAGHLRCLDNHAVEGAGKFVLGPKSVFTLKWQELKQAKKVFVSEGIIDYLSVKTLEITPPAGLALLGNQLCFERELLQHADTILCASDDDRGGTSAVLDLKERYPGKEVRIYDLEGHKDPNEFLLAVRSGKGRRLSAERKLQLYREFQQASNKAELARRWGIDRSYLYEVVRDCDETLIESLSSRKPGRPVKGAPGTLEEAARRIKELEEEYEREAKKREEQYCRSQFLALRLKWAEIEAAELRGEAVDEEKGPEKKSQVKKKEKKETLEEVEALKRKCPRLSSDEIMRHTCFSRSQLYSWKKSEELDRKKRAPKVLGETTVQNAAGVIGTFPYFGGRKGQAYMLYHELGYVGMKAYDRIKKHVKRLLGQEAARRKLLPKRRFYEHIRPKKQGEIWAEDFTELALEGHTFKLAVLLDVFDGYYLGGAVDTRATASLVGLPVQEALELTGGRGPERFLLSDNGSQYISEEHDRLLTSAEIIQRRIPACVPQYNGWAEGGMRQLKSVFYNVWERRKREGADEEESLLARVQAAVKETLVALNEVIARPSLGGVTPADVHGGMQAVQQERIREYREKEESRRDIPPWKRNYWEILKSGLKVGDMTSDELLTKLAFFCRRPLRRIAQRNLECVG